MDNETQDLLQQLETENNGKITYKTYALFLGNGERGVKNLGGLLYIVNNRLIFEDFERQGGMLQLLVKRKQKYEKTKFSLTLDDVTRIDPVFRSTANYALRTRTEGRSIPKATGLMKVVRRIVTQICTKNGGPYYFELFDEKGLKTFTGK